VYRDDAVHPGLGVHGRLATADVAYLTEQKLSEINRISRGPIFQRQFLLDLVLVLARIFHPIA
jgi:hypothetical protein